MKVRTGAAAAIYAGSYLPLAVILFVQDYNFEQLKSPMCVPFINRVCGLPLCHPWFAFGFLAGAFICFFISLFALNSITPKNIIKIKSIKHIPADLMNYSLPYVVAFMTLDYEAKSKFFGFLIFLIWIFIISFRSGQIILNPVLTVFGWQLYEIDYSHIGADTVHTDWCLSKVTLRPDANYRQDKFDDILIIKRNAQLDDPQVAAE